MTYFIGNWSDFESISIFLVLSIIVIVLTLHFDVLLKYTLSNFATTCQLIISTLTLPVY